jgi:4-hydroxybenzoate polyprenyltransferase
MIYPLLKRVTYWPQAWLGICMNFGFFTAHVMATGEIDQNLFATMMVGMWW